MTPSYVSLYCIIQNAMFLFFLVLKTHTKQTHLPLHCCRRQSQFQVGNNMIKGLTRKPIPSMPKPLRQKHIHPHHKGSNPQRNRHRQRCPNKAQTRPVDQKVCDPKMESQRKHRAENQRQNNTLCLEKRQGVVQKPKCK